MRQNAVDGAIEPSRAKSHHPQSHEPRALIGMLQANDLSRSKRSTCSTYPTPTATKWSSRKPSKGHRKAVYVAAKRGAFA